MTTQITITLTLAVEAQGAEVVAIDVTAPASVSAAADTGGVSSAVTELIDTNASPALAPHLRRFAERCTAELELSLQLPESGTRPYLNGYPPKRFGLKRAVAFDARSGRAEIYCDPAHVSRFGEAEVVTNNKVPFAAKVYLQSNEAVDEAVELTRLGLEDRAR
jgi:hypothetical protein